MNCVSPGLIDTQRQAGSVQAQAHRKKSTNLFGKRGTAQDVAGAVAFLCGPQARYLTGQIVHANGAHSCPEASTPSLIADPFTDQHRLRMTPHNALPCRQDMSPRCRPYGQASLCDKAVLGWAGQDS